MTPIPVGVAVTTRQLLLTDRQGRTAHQNRLGSGLQETETVLNRPLDEDNTDYSGPKKTGEDVKAWDQIKRQVIWAVFF